MAKPIATTLAMGYDQLIQIMDALVARETPYNKMALTIGRMSVPVAFKTQPSQHTNEIELVIEAALPRKMLYPRFEGTLRVRTVGGFGAELDLNGIIEVPLAGASNATSESHGKFNRRTISSSARLPHRRRARDARDRTRLRSYATRNNACRVCRRPCHAAHDW